MTTRVDALDLMAYYNIEVIIRGDEAAFRCPFHHDNDPSANINILTSLWTCFRCKIGGSPIDFVSRLENWDYRRAERWLRDRYGGFVKPQSLLREISQFIDKGKTKYYPEKILQKFQYPTTYWESRGFNRQVIKTFELGYDPKTRRATIPIRSYDGKLIGIQGRTVEKDVTAKYVFIRNVPKNKHLYGLHLIESDYVVVVESALAVIRLAMFNIPAVSTLGSSVSDEQAYYLNGFKKVYMLFDNDEAGFLGMFGNIEKKRFNNSAWKKIKSRVYLPDDEEYEDIDLMTATEVNNLLESSKNAHVWMPLLSCKAFGLHPALQ